MAVSWTDGFEMRNATGSTRADALARMDLLATLLDSAFMLPGIDRRVGIDAVLGLVPVVGDALSALLSAYIIWEARRLGLPRWKIARMIGNVAVDTAVGAIPVVGDAFDVLFKANRRNMRIVHDHFGHGYGPRTIDGTATRVEER